MIPTAPSSIDIQNNPSQQSAGLFGAMVRRLLLPIAILLFSIHLASLANALSSETFSNPAVTSRLISVENGVTPNAKSVSLGLDLQLGKGWKTYWRSPGEVGFPPSIDWTGSTNLSKAQIFWPAPKRFTAFGIENFGYADQVILPIQVTLQTPGEAVSLVAKVSVLTCLDVCVPHEVKLSLDIPAGSGIDAESAALVAEFSRKVPSSAEGSNIKINSVALAATGLVIAAETTVPFAVPDVFPELGPQFTFGKPDIRLSNGNKNLWAYLPILARGDQTPKLSLTLTDRGRSITATPDWADGPAPPPFEILKSVPGVSKLISIALIALLGGLILNVMPCVLPVLSIKVYSVLNHSGHSRARVRSGFLFAALGIITFMMTLAASVLVLQMAGFSVGWGLQFQSPLFIVIMFLILVLFSANLFGLYEITLPPRFQTNLSASGAKAGYIGDFATGAFAAILATPCSAPFLGTAIAFALTGRPLDVFLVFLMLGVGLAAPYLLLAVQPNWVNKLPKPGRWMIIIKTVMAALLALTAFWLLWVLKGVSGPTIAVTIAALAGGLVFLTVISWRNSGIRFGGITALFLGAIAVSIFGSSVTPRGSVDQNWVAFDRGEIPKLVSQGKTIFVDVTADWCLTCKANKALVLGRDPVSGILESEQVVAMQADWTRPSETISSYLEAHNRFGIPFNIVYGPNAPNGIVLSEILTIESVQNAIESASR